MKVQGVNNNQNNLSHKAYFKRNAMFNNLCDRSLQYITEEAISKFNALPNHELEILSVTRNKFSGVDCIAIFNNTTKKRSVFAITGGDKLKELVDILCGKSQEVDWFFKRSEPVVAIYEKLTRW